MSRSTVFWDTRCLLTRFACRKSVGQATSRRSAGDASASTFRSVIDIRELPISRRKGFAKKALSESLTHAGIEYVHLRGLGDPKEGREAARAGNLARFIRTFNRHMESERAQADLQSAVRYVAEGGACLMCYERDHTICHRTIVAQIISHRMDAIVYHLGRETWAR